MVHIFTDIFRILINTCRVSYNTYFYIVKLLCFIQLFYFSETNPWRRQTKAYTIITVINNKYETKLELARNDKENTL